MLNHVVYLRGKDGIGGIHGNQNALDIQTVVAVFLDKLVVLQKLRKPLCGQKLRLCRNNNAVGAHHHVNHGRTHLGHTVNDDVLIAVLDGVNVL